MALDLWLVPDTVFLGKVGVNHYLLKTELLAWYNLTTLLAPSKAKLLGRTGEGVLTCVI